MINIPAKPRLYPIENINQVGLLVIDMQRDFFSEEGFGASLGNDVRNVWPCKPYVVELVKLFRAVNRPIIFTKEAQNPNLSNCPLTKKNRSTGPLRIGDPSPLGRILIAGTEGSDLIPEIQQLVMPQDTVIYKPGKDAFWGTDLAGILMNLRLSHLIICGVTTDVCVQTTMREANDRGYICLLAEDATDSYYPRYKEWTIEMVTSQGAIVGWAASNAAIVRAFTEYEQQVAISGIPILSEPQLRVGSA